MILYVYVYIIGANFVQRKIAASLPLVHTFTMSNDGLTFQLQGMYVCIEIISLLFIEYYRTYTIYKYTLYIDIYFSM